MKLGEEVSHRSLYHVLPDWVQDFKYTDILVDFVWVTVFKKVQITGKKLWY